MEITLTPETEKLLAEMHVYWASKDSVESFVTDCVLERLEDLAYSKEYLDEHGGRPELRRDAKKASKSS